jgi:hypothetical protein
MKNNENAMEYNEKQWYACGFDCFSYVSIAFHTFHTISYDAFYLFPSLFVVSHSLASVSGRMGLRYACGTPAVLIVFHLFP